MLAKETGLPARAVRVDLGTKGTWYRSVVGEFITFPEALAARGQEARRIRSAYRPRRACIASPAELNAAMIDPPPFPAVRSPTR
jgi:hypothetical protein